MQATSERPEGLWVTLTKDLAGTPAGEKIKLASAAEKESLIAAGLAQSCADPEEQIVHDTVEKMAASVVDAAVSAVDKRLEEFAASTDGGRGERLFALPRDATAAKMNGFSSAGEFLDVGRYRRHTGQSRRSTPGRQST